jgi:hypothetical protein
VRKTLSIGTDEWRYRGVVTFEHWREVARDAGERGLIRATAADQIADIEDP